MNDTVELRLLGLTIEEVKEMLVKFREIEQRDPERYFSAALFGLGDKSLDEAKEIVKDIFPRSKSGDFFTATIKTDK